MSPELHIDILQKGRETVKVEVKPGGTPFSRIFNEGGNRVLVIGTFSQDGKPKKHEVTLRDGEGQNNILGDPSRWGDPTELETGRIHSRVFGEGNPDQIQVVYFYVPPNVNNNSAS